MALTSIVTNRGVQQFQGAFDEMWVVSCAVDFGAVADGDEEDQQGTVDGLALGDMILGISLSIDVEDVTISGAVVAANTLNLQALNNTGGSKNLGAATAKVLIGRPAW
tara:strand:+ start:5153 stop:5476 length:324 start_codon:yes stop_codon:yes gene_type:complete